MNYSTIQASDATKRKLDILKTKRRISFDKILQEILPQHLSTPRSLAGAFPGLKCRKKTDRMLFKSDE